jgi:hypothetical protein
LWLSLRNPLDITQPIDGVSRRTSVETIVVVVNILSVDCSRTTPRDSRTAPDCLRRRQWQRFGNLFHVANLRWRCRSDRR